MKHFLPIILLILSLNISAQPRAGYYNNAIGKADALLKTQLYGIISSGTNDVGYAGLYNIYPTSDNTLNGKVWDMYSTCTWTHGVAKCGNYSSVCDCYNREHSIPQSWFNSNAPMVSDAFHVYPTDGKVNGQRNNYPFGECSAGVSLNGGRGRLGNSTFPGYSGIVFEPDDEFKGDFARTYFYFATRYQNIMTTIGGESFNNTTYPSLSDWTINVFLKWHRQDPVSTKETVRNNAVEVFQRNRNPFIDYPDLAEYIWGTKKGLAWSLTSGIDNLKIEFSLSPNPVQNLLNVKADENDLKYIVFDIKGLVLLENSLSFDRTISVNSLQNGMYLLQLNSGNRKSIQKFIVNR